MVHRRPFFDVSDHLDVRCILIGSSLCFAFVVLSSRGVLRVGMPSLYTVAILLCMSTGSRSAQLRAFMLGCQCQ